MIFKVPGFHMEKENSDKTAASEGATTGEKKRAPEGARQNGLC